MSGTTGGVSQTKLLKKHHLNWCFQKTMETFEHPKKRPSSTGRIIFPASNSSLEKRRQHPVKCNRRAALPPDHKGFLGHFLHQVENRETKTQGWVFCYGTYDICGWKMIWFSWDLLVIVFRKGISVKTQLIQFWSTWSVAIVAQGNLCCTIPWIDPIGWLRVICAIHCCVLVIDDYRPLKLT